MAKKHIERCTISYVTREMQITTMRYYYRPIRMAKIQNAVKVVEQQEVSFTAGRNVKWYSHSRQSGGFLKN